MNKSSLYRQVTDWIGTLGIEKEDYPLNAIALAKTMKNLCIMELPFEDLNVGGALLKDKVSTMCLNANKNFYDKNFDCMHELIHFSFHKQCAFNCLSTAAKITQDSFIEWQANEGAAQALVPYQLFLPEYKKSMRRLEIGDYNYDDFFCSLSIKFSVSETVLKYRIESLSYEILQYTNNIPINEIVLLSRQERIKRNFLKLSDRYLPYRFKQTHEYDSCE